MSDACIVLKDVCCQIGGQTVLDIPALRVASESRFGVSMCGCPMKP